jgi:type IV secretion system T-DNA border endonuclease VirD2
VIRTDEEGRAVIVDQAAADRIIIEVEAARMGAHSSTPVSVSVARDLQTRYPDMPEQLAEGLTDTYARVYEAHSAEREIRLTERETDQNETPELSRVLVHERAGELSSPFETATEREAFRTEVARVLDAAQLDRLKEGDSDALENVIEDRLDRLYAAKVYLQSDAATANSDALRQVVDELADVEVERHRAADVDGETERGQIH